MTPPGEPTPTRPAPLATRTKIAAERTAGATRRPSEPQRTCVGCRTTRTADELVRVARAPDGTLAIGRTLPGRGAWLCRESLATCSDQAIRKGGFARAFRTSVPAESLRALAHQIEALTAGSASRFVPGSPPARD